MYSLPNPVEIREPKIAFMNIQEISAIVNGFIAQLTISVTSRGFEFLRTLTISLNSILSMIGNIMKRRTIATGIDTFAICQFPSVSASPGKMLPSRAPRTIATATQIERYLLNISSFCSDIFSSIIFIYSNMRI
jgi:hypothetical protein